MKVCTDACIQGAFTATYIRNSLPGVQEILDIGTGTGLLSLMLAQQCSARIDAVELDETAAAQAAENFVASPWSGRLRMIREDVRSFSPAGRYPFIITNPPFYENDLKSSDHQRNAAMHATTLDFEALLAAVRRLLTEDGQFSVMLEHKGFQRFRQLAEAGGFTLRVLLEVHPSVGREAFRSVGVFGGEGALTTEQLVIHDQHQQYTPEFISLLKPYYLYL